MLPRRSEQFILLWCRIQLSVMEFYDSLCWYSFWNEIYCVVDFGVIWCLRSYISRFWVLKKRKNRLYWDFGFRNHWVLFPVYAIPHLPHLFQEIRDFILSPSAIAKQHKSQMLDLFFNFGHLVHLSAFGTRNPEIQIFSGWARTGSGT